MIYRMIRKLTKILPILLLNLLDTRYLVLMYSIADSSLVQVFACFIKKTVYLLET